MTESFDVCVACRRHIKHGDARCPFCRASNEHVRSDKGMPPQRVSRARWALMGSALAMTSSSSSGAEVDSSDGDATATSDTRDATVVDTSSPDGRDAIADTSSADARDAFTIDTRDAAPIVVEGGRDEADVLACPVANVTHFTCRGESCICQPPVLGDYTCGIDTFDGATEFCLSCLTCACDFGWYTHCEHADGGDAVTRVWTTACYGCPPARLERMLLSV
jgi:hypothetical protein